ncbi:MAG TPA: DUF6325 family protein [Aldersonia sp.]
MPTALQLDKIGPVDVAVIVFEGNQFSGQVAPALLDLHRSDVVHIIDLAFVARAEDGSTIALEIEDPTIAEHFGGIVEDPVDLLSDDDLGDIAEGLEPGNSALVIVWENSWAAAFTTAVRNSNGEVILHDRIPREIVEAAVAALDEE